MVKTLFTDNFQDAPSAFGRAFGRANLIGDHTDYNNGFVLPCLLNHHTDVALRLTGTGQIEAVSDSFGKNAAAIDSQPDGSWLDFIRGAVTLLEAYNIHTSGIEVAVTSTVPAGAGVSSSAALEIALLRAMIAGHDAPAIPAKNMALIAQKIEHEFVSTQCGIMDQMVCASAAQGQAMLLDCETLDQTLFSLFSTEEFLVIHSGSSRKLSSGLYNTRLAECKSAAATLGVNSLRAADAANIADLSDPIQAARARHVISENLRVLAAAEALEAQDAEQFGALMHQSHLSLAKDYEVSSAELDTVVETAMSAGAFGARLTGAGFGGCVIVLAAKSDADRIRDKIALACPDSWLVDRISASDRR